METVKTCIKKKDYTDKQGRTVGIYEVEFTDGSKAESFAKEIPVGTPTDQLIIEDSNFGLKVKMKPSENKGGFGGGKARSGNESFSLSYSKDLVVAGKVDIKDILAIADKLYNWLESKKK